jgi:hypothetical protein
VISPLLGEGTGRATGIAAEEPARKAATMGGNFIVTLLVVDEEGKRDE